MAACQKSPRKSRNYQKNSENDVIPDSVLSSAAETAAYFSEAANSENVAVDYTERRNVRRIKDAGLGMVNYDDYKTIFVTPKTISENSFVTSSPAARAFFI